MQWLRRRRFGFLVALEEALNGPSIYLNERKVAGHHEDVELT